MTTHPAADVRFVVGIFLILLKFFVFFLNRVRVCLNQMSLSDLLTTLTSKYIFTLHFVNEIKNTNMFHLSKVKS